MFQSKKGFLVPMVCNFDIHLDINLGLQLLCFGVEPNFINFVEDKIPLDKVYFISTNSSGIIDGCTENFAKRFGISMNSLFLKQINIDKINFMLTDLN